MRIAAAIALLFGAQFAAVGLHALGSNGDLAWQQWLGEYVLRVHHLPTALGDETFTAAGAHWTPQEWLFSTELALALRVHAFAFFAIAIATLACASLVVVAVRARARGASLPATLVTTLFAGISCSQMFGVRAQIAAWLLLGLFLLALERRDAWNFAAIPIVALWANVHASAMLAPVLAAVWTTGVALDEGWRSPRALRCIVLTAGSALATLATPLGAGLPAYASHLVGSPIRAHIQEWRAPHLGDGSLAAGLLPLVLAGVVALALRRRADLRDALLFIAALALSAQAVRNIPLAALAVAPLVAQWITPYLTDRSRVATLLRERGVATLATGVILVASIALSFVTLRLPFTPLPAYEVQRAAELPGARRLYCEDFAWCSLALSRSNLRTFLDGRCDPFPLAVWRGYVAVETGKGGWHEPLARYGVDTVIASNGRPLDQALRGDRAWRIVTQDRRYTLFARD